MASVGPQDGTVAADDSAVGVTAWTSTSNALTAGAGVASNTVTSATNVQSHYLKITGFDFSAIPSGATIDGILVEVRRVEAGVYGVVVDTIVKLLVAGVVSGNNKASVAEWVSSIYVSYGGATDKWGLTLTDTDIKDPNFGMVISALVQGMPGIAQIDHVRITVSYTLSKRRLIVNMV